MTNTGSTPAGWYYAPGDPAATQRYWDGAQWVGEPQPVNAPPAPPSAYDQPVPPPPGAAPPGYLQPGYQQPPPGYVAYGTDPTPAGQLSSPGRRIGARLIDALIWIAVGLVIGVGFGVGLVANGGISDDVSYGLFLGVQVLSLAIVVAYEVGMVATKGATLGKMALGMKVTTEDGAAPDAKVALMRMSTYIGFGILAFIPSIARASGIGNFIVALVSLIFLFTHAKRQTIWDLIAKTVVVDT